MKATFWVHKSFESEINSITLLREISLDAEGAYTAFKTLIDLEK